ncbi:MAG: hypothetical protein H7282_02820 [Cytophagaceae bacterium]|nr:hypothetical protein [Cytophagaceae bacterium]
MKKNTIVLLSLTFLLANCSQNTDESKKESSKDTLDNVITNNGMLNKSKYDTVSLDIDFDEYVSSLDQIPLPLKHNPLAYLPELSTHYSKEGFEKYKSESASQPFGILYKNENTITLVDYSIGDIGPAPFFTTYDKLGNKIDSLAPYKKTGGDDGYYAIEYISILSDHTLVVEDSVVTWPTGAERSKLNEKISTAKIKYVFEKDGRISSHK